ncbi:3-deoxy-D-manno-octulosonic acid transferase [Olleya marilimosa]|uniref:3-deoxy-D-manno-octulosonic acid transferase n=1 Tax=Olleya marilimosa TaxID=272164 RepID=A0ABR8LZP8_9FLAO|nr:glycosyltransferase N-terminal domain-containing protein [Olleya marilimosa]MBD3864594.1 3-deoxy-D-manno-octulosonic acid transferase [Olleya marilimosa]MBD3892075.1 3-deoxy-D-manno-octulosonic acid transferase [Olleya marilimosa]
MNLLYNITIQLASVVLKLLSLFNNKLKLGVDGRALTFNKLDQFLNKGDKTLWFHCASLGEYEQGLPIFTELRKDYPNHKIVLSFFSPSGYEIRKKAPFADLVVYLPLDTKNNAKRFINLVNPELTVFVKYEIWPNYLNEIKSRGLRALLISAVFRKDQSFFKWYGSQTKKALFAFEHIFTQNETSKKLLESINYTNATISGDTRFDRVSNQLNTDNNLDFIKAFKDNKLCIVIGSSWPEDETLIIEFINNYLGTPIKFIIAPHNIKSKQIENIQTNLKKPSILFTQKEKKDLSQYDVFILDTIGLLSKAYSYADIAYVGGAMGNTGLHNILEPAVFGAPIIIGKNYQKFPEAFDMIKNKGVKSVSNITELGTELNSLINDPESRLTTGNQNADFIKKNKGAVIQIMQYLRK